MSRQYRNIFNLDYLMATLMVFAILLFFPQFFQLDMFDPIQNTLEDMELTDLAYNNLRNYDEIKTDSNIVLINLSHLNRAEAAEMINIINQYNPKVIAIDAFFRAEKGPEMDFPLMSAFMNTQNLILACELISKPESENFDSVKYSNPMFNQYAKNGFVNLYISDDSFQTPREVSPKEAIYGTKDTIYSLPVMACKVFAPAKAKRFLERNNELEIINYKRNTDKYITLDYYEVFDRSDDLHFIKDKIVLIGYLGPNLKTKVTEDIFFTPMNKNVVGKTEPGMYGMVVHANVISMMIEEDYINTYSFELSVIIAFLLVYINMIFLGVVRTMFPHWYQAFNVFFVIFEMIFLAFVIIFVYEYMDFSIKIFGTFLPLLICVLCFETYLDSIKPITITFYQRIKTKRNKTNQSEIDNENDEKDNSKDEVENENI